MKITRRLRDLLGKILKEIREIERGHENAENLLTVREKSDLEIITRMYRQRKNHFRNNDSRESIPNRIVSLSKPHLRPIVRGKEVKGVEFMGREISRAGELGVEYRSEVAGGEDEHILILAAAGPGLRVVLHLVEIKKAKDRKSVV